MAASSSSSAMDTSGFSQIGRYGTICLMKRQEPDTAITAFGIDTEELTFGRDPSCGVRLYYPDVSLIHCKIIFDERKAFLVVLGANGLLIDGCKVYPNTSPSPSATPITIPLTNNSEFEIHGKRFRFSYPPKELRAVLFATPARPSPRKLRLSMIHSAQVFSPRPSSDPRENLRILKSPLKNVFKMESDLFTPRMNSFPSVSQNIYQTPVRDSIVGPNTTNNEEEEEENIILVDGNHPRVVEDEKDLVILEDVDVSSNSTSPQQYQHQPVQTPQFQTPVRQRSRSRNTLHRAVLIRSAQRAVLQAEHAGREREEEEEEEMEVFETVASGATNESEEEVSDEDEQLTSEDNEEYSESDGDGESEEYEDMNETGRDSEEQKSTWRKSLERIWPFRSSSVSAEQDEDDDDEKEDVNDESGSENEREDGAKAGYDENQDTPRAQVHGQAQTPIRRTLGPFMTPQVHPRTKNFPAVPSNDVFGDENPENAEENTGVMGAGRHSLGGGEARRVVKEQVWRVSDIVVPPMGNADSSPTRSIDHASTGTRRVSDYVSTPARTRPLIDDEEKKAIQERRRSAVREIGTFLPPGGALGMGESPGKIRGWSPAKGSYTSSIASGSAPALSPFRPSSPTKPTAQFKPEKEEEEEEIDTRSLLERMKETVEVMKKRRSLAPSEYGTPMRDGIMATPARMREPGTPVQSKRMAYSSPSKGTEPGITEVPEEDEGDKENSAQASELPEPFSLLRPGVLEEIRAKEDASTEVERLPEVIDPEDDVAEDKPSVAHHIGTVPIPIDIPALMEEMEEEAPVDVPIAIDDEATDLPLPKKGGRARLLRGKKPQAQEGGPTDEALQQMEMEKPRTAARRTKPHSAKSSAKKEEPPAPPSTLSKSVIRRERKATVEPENKEDGQASDPPTKRGRKATTVEAEEVTLAPTRRGRKTTVEPEEPPKEEVAVVAPARRGRKPATPPPLKAEEDEAVNAPLPPAKRGSRQVAAAETPKEPVPRRGRTPRTAPSALPTRRTTASGLGTIDVETIDDNGADPLDSLEAGEMEAVIAKPKGRKAVVKKEEAVEEEVAVPVKRNAKAKVPVVKTLALKPRAIKKVPATAPATVQDVDKENTPGSEGSSIDEPVKIRVSRTTKGGAKVKQEDPERGDTAEPEATRRSVRATRARTRT